MPLFIIVGAIQLFFIVHAIRTGKEQFWIWVLIGVPGLGGLAYFITQFLPEYSRTISGQRAKRKIIRTFDPDGEQRQRQDNLEISDSVANRLDLADEYIENGRCQDALEILQPANRGLYQDDPRILSRMALAHFKADAPEKCVETPDLLIEKNPDYQSVDDHLLYARALEAAGHPEKAVAEYEVLKTTFPGEEARIRYAELLHGMSRQAEAQALFKETLVRARRAPKHYQKKESRWIDIAKRHTDA